MTGMRIAACAAVLFLAAEAAGAEGPSKAPPAPPPPSAAAAKGRELLDSGKVEEAEKLLRDALAADPADGEARLLLGNVLDWDGRPDDALGVWEAGLVGKDPDVPLLMAVGALHLRRAADGPLVTRRRGNQEMKFTKEPVDEEGFRGTHREAGLAAYRKAAAIRPADIEVGLALADLLSDLGRADEALKAWEVLGKRTSKDPAVLVGLGRALLASGKKPEAKGKIDQALKVAPRSSDAHEAMSEWLEASGKGMDATAAHRRAQIFGWLPAFSKLEFSDALYDQVAALAVDPFWNSKDATDAERMWKKKRDIVDALLAKKDEPSWDLLVAICWNHCCHGPIESGIFQALTDRGKPSVPVLLRMLRERSSTCTVGGAAKALARMKEASAFEEVCARLPKDVDPMFPMDIAGVLVLYGDPRAVPALVAALDLDAPPEPKKPREKGGGRTVVIGAPGGDTSGESMDGRGAARGRAAFALGEFDVPEARAALEKGCANPEVGAFCHAVLWRLTKDEKAHGKAVAAAMNAEGVARWMIGPYLERIDHPNAKYLLDRWRKEQEGKK